MGMTAVCKNTAGGSGNHIITRASVAEREEWRARRSAVRVRQVRVGTRAAQYKMREIGRTTWACWQSGGEVQGGGENGHVLAASSVRISPLYRPPLLPQKLTDILEALIERAVFSCRFSTLLAVVGSLGGSVICFIQGCRFVSESFSEYVHIELHGVDTGHTILLLVEAIYIFLVATVMLIFGMGIYELFISTIGLQKSKRHRHPSTTNKDYTGSSFFGLFKLEERPQWLEIRSLHELKIKVGHVIVMILLVGMFEKSKQVPMGTGFDLLCFGASIFMSSGCLFLLSKLNVK